MKYSAIERALGIPQNTLEKDKSASGKALKKIINTFPWIVDVADKKYDKKEAKRIMMKNAVDKIVDQS